MFMRSSDKTDDDKLEQVHEYGGLWYIDNWVTLQAIFAGAAFIIQLIWFQCIQGQHKSLGWILFLAHVVVQVITKKIV